MNKDLEGPQPEEITIISASADKGKSHIQAVLARRRSGAAGIHEDKRTKRKRTRATREASALKESNDSYDN